MNSDPDSPPATPTAESSSSALPDRELRAVEAAVAGVAGLLIGRVLLGRAGGLAAGLAALGAGLMGKRPPPSLLPASPDLSANHEVPPPDAEGSPDTFPAHRQTASGEPVDAGVLAAVRAIAESPEDAGAFAEMPALFEPIAPVVPPAEATAATPATATMPGLPVTTLLERAASELDAASRSELPTSSAAAVVPAPSLFSVPLPTLLEAFPAEFARLNEEQEPGLREEFLLIPPEAPQPLPPLEPVVEALSRSLASPEPPESAQPLMRSATPAEAPPPVTAEEASPLPVVSPPAVPSGPVAELQGTISVVHDPPASATALPAPAPSDNGARPDAEQVASLTSFARPAAAPPPGTEVGVPAPVRPLAAPVRPIPLQPPTPLTESTLRPASPPVRPIPLTAAGSAISSPPPVPLPASAPDLPAESIPGRTMPVPPPSPERAANAIPEDASRDASREVSLPPLGAPGAPAPDPDEIWRQAAAELPLQRAEPASPLPPSLLADPSLATAAVFPVPVPAPAGPLPPSPPAAEVAVKDSVPATAPLPSWLSQPPPTPPAVPPWLQESSAPAARAEPRPFLPTIRLAVPGSPQPLAMRTPPAQAAEAPPAPVSLPGYRAEPLAPAPAEVPKSMASASAAPVPAVGVPPVGVPPGPTPTSATVPAGAAVPLLASVHPGSIPPGTIHVERKEMQRLLGKVTPRRSVLTPGVVGVLTVLAAILLGFAFKPQLQKFWEERILGRSPTPTLPAAGPALPPANSDAPDVRVVPGDEEPGVPESPPATEPGPGPASPAPAGEPAAPGLPRDSSPATPDPPDSEPLPAPPPPGAPEDDSATALPVNETGASALVGVLLRATAAEQVLPHILDADRLRPSVES